MIRKIISTQHASRFALMSTGLLIALHLPVILGILPFGKLWTELADSSAVLPLELIIIVTNVSYGLFILIKMKYLERGENSKLLTIFMYLLVLILLTRSIIKFISPAAIDHFFIAPLLLLMAFFTLRLALEK